MLGRAAAASLDALQTMAKTVLAKATRARSPTVHDVHSHLAEWKTIYDVLDATADPVAFHAHALALEDAYSRDASTINFAARVHQLHPIAFAQDTAMRRPPTSLQSMLSHCPHCGASIAPTTAFRVHMQQAAAACHACHGRYDYETYKLVAYIDAHPFCATSTTVVVDTPSLPHDGSWDTFLARQTAAIRATRPSQDAYNDAQMTRRRHMLASIRRGLNPAISLDLVHGMFRQLRFLETIGREIDYWSDPAVLRASIERYERFMALTSPSPLVPTVDIDLVWHAHLTQPKRYAHLERTSALWQHAYNEPYTRPSAVAAEGTPVTETSASRWGTVLVPYDTTALVSRILQSTAPSRTPQPPIEGASGDHGIYLHDSDLAFQYQRRAAAEESNDSSDSGNDGCSGCSGD
ncbi:hypothetical protein SPRG_04241 [Saprolegnia parasitica CBS 223.65]|uniref:Uncharacterized protein n=1 Tax=Saprolegnia parasitica (strain CBS 223.65) TaxID=695850 RepID=A0A067CWD5_SAPPC|nr:hypothetical protein SPRG_04241 [Saprolegnia parasitica CBS 223.65]KDO31102.1 hypothetical protein SPRG_04241 [Saprolegnia parasitica CBS 223.65]|eukprot:XP_012198231.1 hypothetical protein SPRG_04241 [Saprolegnia parasitica CBS 223.65]